MVAAARSPADSARDGQSVLERAVRHRASEDGGRLRRIRRAAIASGAARLARPRIPRLRLGRERTIPADRNLGHVPAERRDDAGEAGKGSRQPLAGPRPAIPHGCRNGSRLRAGREWIAVAKNWRAEREAVSAAGRVGGGGDDWQRYARLQAGLWRRV